MTGPGLTRYERFVAWLETNDVRFFAWCCALYVFVSLVEGVRQ